MGGRLFARKPVAHVQAEFHTGEMKRTLGPFNLVSLGVGAIIGAGIFVMTGQAAAVYAGPAVAISFVIAGIACTFAALCYAELASTIPVSGSAYSYAYVTMGEVFAWTMGWLLLLEYGLAASTVAAGWTGYVVSLVHDFGVIIPPQFAESMFQYQDGALVNTGHMNLVGAAGILAVSLLLVVGVSESATVNNIIVAIKVIVLLAFIAIGVTYVNPANWDPFVPPNEGGAHFGPQGVLRAASVVFFAYVGFEAVSTAAGEARNPQKDLPIGILGSLVICTLIYMAVAMVMTGVVPFRELGVPAPIAVAIDRMNPEWAMIPWANSETGTLNILSLLIKIGAFAGLTSVMLVLIYAQTRVFYQMARDGLIPGFFAQIHKTFKTPAMGTIVLGILIAIAAALLPLGVLGDLVSLGTALAFAIVCISVMYMRSAHPEIARPFKVPLYPITPILGVIACVLFMMGPILIGLASQATGIDYWAVIFGGTGTVTREYLPTILLVTYIVIGALVYAFYGFRNSKLTHTEAPK